MGLKILLASYIYITALISQLVYPKLWATTTVNDLDYVPESRRCKTWTIVRSMKTWLRHKVDELALQTTKWKTRRRI
jgi:hypothetical protein